MQGHMKKSIVNTTEPDSMKTKKTCSHKGCTSYARKGGVCVTNGAKVKRCSFEGCTNQVRCSFEGCASSAQKGGVCWRHGAK